MANFINYIVESAIQPVKTNVLWIKNGVPYYFNKKWKPLLGGASGGSVIGEESPIISGVGENSALLWYSDNTANGESSVALGKGTSTNNLGEAAFGLFNRSIKSNDVSEATLFSVGKGTTNLPKNVFEIKYDGNIYIEGIDISIQKYLKQLKSYNDNFSLEFDKIIEETNNSIKEVDSKITRTAEEILVEVNEVTSELNDLIAKNTAAITVTAEEIRSEVSETIKEVNTSITENTTKITQTANQVQSVATSLNTVTDKVQEQETIITQTSERIDSIASKNTELENKLTETESKVTQTSEQITSEVSRLETKYDDELNTTKNSISSIDQKADSINSKVDEVITTTTNLQTQITENTSEINQTKSSIELLVKENEQLESRITKTEADIEINTNSINARVEKESFDAYKGEVFNQFTEVNQTIEGVNTTVQSHTGEITELKVGVEGLTVKTGTLEADIDSLKKQSDGSIDTHFGTTRPTLDNEPAINWETENEKREHTGDIYYNNITGEAYRFSYDPTTQTYFWVELTDSALTEALDKISKLEGAVDGKSTTYIVDLTDSSKKYKLGDIWILPTDLGIYKKGTLLTCVKDFSTIFSWSDWENLTRYTDDSALENFIVDYTSTINNIKTQVDKKAETWYQSADPSTDWTSEELKTLHIGDLWFNTSTQETFHWNGLVWEIQNIPKDVFDTIDSKSSVFVSKPTSYQVNDIWILESDYLLNNTSYKKGTWVVATESSDVWNASHWIKKDSYTDDSAVTELNTYVDGAFKDVVLEESEKTTIREAKKVFDATFDEISTEYTYLLIAQYSSNTEKEYLTSKYTQLEDSKNKLDTALQNILNHDENSTNSLQELKAIYDSAYINFVKALQLYREAVEKLQESININLNSANVYIENVASDNILTPIEKKQLLEIWQRISEEFNSNKGIAVNYKIIDSEGNKRTDIYTTDEYYSVYNTYKSKYDVLVNIFQTFELTKLDVSTTLPEGYSITSTNNALNEYYNALKNYSELISKITIEITDAHDRSIAIANSWQEHLNPNDEVTQIGKGLVLSTVIGVQSNGTLEAVLNASDDIPGSTDEDHGKIIFAGGIGGSENWNDATTVIYEDGYVKFKYGEISEGIKLGNAIINSIISGDIDLFSYPENGKLTPLFQINKNESGKIVSISSLYDLYINGNLIVSGNTASGGAGSPTAVGVDRILVNGEEYQADNGAIDLTEAFNDIDVTSQLGDYAKKDEVSGALNALNESIQGDLNAVSGKVVTLESTLQTEQGYIDTLQGYFSNGIAKKATADAKGNTIDSYYTPITTHNAFVTATNTAIGKKADANNVYTIAQIDAKVLTINEALANRYTKGEIDTKVSAIDAAITTLDNKYTPVKTWYDNLASIFFKDGDSIRIKSNLIVEGNTASGGVAGGGGSVSVALLKAWSEYNALTMTGYALSAGLGYDLHERVSELELNPKVTATNIVNALGYTPYDASNPVGYITASALSGYQLSSGLGSLAYKNSLVASDIPDLSSKYLPISGGTIDSRAYTPLIIRRNTDNGLAIRFENSFGFLGEIGVHANGYAVFVDATATHTLIHSGNIGSQSVAGAKLLLDHLSSRITSANVGVFGDSGVRKFIVSSSMTEAAPANDGSILHFSWDNNAGYEHQLFISNFGTSPADGRMAWRAQVGGTWSDWKPIAFTDSTVAAANKLTTASGVDYLTASGVNALFANNAMFNNKKYVYFADTTGEYRHVIGVDGNNTLLIGRGWSNAGFPTDIAGEYLSFRVNGINQAMFINSSGNVTIGSSDLASGEDWGNRRLYVKGYTANEVSTSQMILTQNAANFSGGAVVFWDKSLNAYGKGTIDASTLYLNSLGGNVLIGTTTDYGAKLGVGGDVVIPNNFSYKILDTAGTARRVIQLNSGNGLLIGQHTAANAYSTNLYGYAISLVCGTANKLTMLLNSSGNVTIGGSDLVDSGEKLHVDGRVRSKAIGLNRESDNAEAFFLMPKSNNELQFQATGGGGFFSFHTAYSGMGERMRIANNGNVGIGTTGPAEKLDIEGGIRTNGGIYPKWGNNADLGKNSLRWNKLYAVSASFTEGVVIDEDLHVNGNVGIGTTSPSFKLDVAGTAKATQYKSVYSSTQWTFGGGVLTDIDTDFALTNSTTYQPYIVVKSNPLYVGIGIKNPAYTLEVGGTGRFSGAVTVGGSATFNNDVRIKGNLIVEGNTASGGSAGTSTIGSIVTFAPSYESGLSLGSLVINGVTSEIYAPTATNSVLGVVKAAAVRTTAISAATGGNTSGRFYGVEVDSDGKMFVNVPWEQGASVEDDGSETDVIGDIRGISGFQEELPNGTHTFYCSKSVTLNLTRVTPANADKGCTIMIVKTIPSTITVNPVSASNIRLFVNGSEANATAATTVSTNYGMILSYINGVWHGYRL